MKCPHCNIDWIFPQTADYIKVPAVHDNRLFIQCCGIEGTWEYSHLVGVYSSKLYPIPLSIEETLKYAKEELAFKESLPHVE